MHWQLGIIIRAASAGHIPPVHFVLVTMGSTSVLLIGWRTLLLSVFPNDKRKKSDVYKRGSPFELFEVRLLSCYTNRLLHDKGNLRLYFLVHDCCGIIFALYSFWLISVASNQVN